MPDRNSCIRSEVRRGTWCGNSKSLEVFIVNECRESVQAQICIQSTNGNWTCGRGPLGPNVAHKQHVCESTGTALIAACDPSNIEGKQFRKTRDCGGSATSSPHSLISAGTKAVLDYPEPDQFKCFADKYFTRGTWCGNPNSVELVMDNRCGIPVQGRICLERRDGSFECGTETLPPRKTMSYHICDGSGMFLTAACDAEKVKGGNFRNGNCAGDPNKQPHGFVPQRSYPPPCPGYQESGGQCIAKPGRRN